MFKRIVKRDGKIVKFDPEKITEAIAKAGLATEEFKYDRAKALTEKVLKRAEEQIKARTPNVEQIQDILTLHQLDTQVLAASFKNSQQVLTLCAYGIGSATCAPAVIDAFVKNPAIDGAVGDFIRDFAGLAGEGKTMADLLG
jgi:transaldolase